MNSTRQNVFGIRMNARGAARVGVVAAVAAIGAGAAVTGWSTQRALASGAAAEGAEAAADVSYGIDVVHSTTMFMIKHMNTTNFYGTFNEFSGDFAVGEAGLSLNVSVKAASVDSRNSKRDEHITGPDFFSAKEFPTITIVAKGLKAGSGDTWSGNADITFRGVTKSVPISVAKTGAGKSRDGKDQIGIEARATIKRSEFGNDYMIGPLSDEVLVVGAFGGVAK